MSHLSKTSGLIEIGYRKAENDQIKDTRKIRKILILRLENSQNPFKGRGRFVHEHSAENIIFGRKWDGRPGIETENASNRSSLVIEICVTPF